MQEAAQSAAEETGDLPSSLWLTCPISAAPFFVSCGGAVWVGEVTGGAEAIGRIIVGTSL